ncbi:adenylate kinase family enzyme [Glutamicibacter mysorens]|uniref:Adenylate kinase family enzyme n=1 Tax=Glutamicibacter mysorens TaxID=257984 RepID=A0ABX4N2T8_9MICC|nr:hypothetical protein [Glutamicibacter mysorens]PJJ44811.1 adenylate kinase family enzyme [Glutamicibacter mysorens]
MKQCRLNIFGASGSGTTILARAVANAWSVPHADSDDYFWIPTDPPYSQQRAPAERSKLMHEIFVPRSAWVLSGSMQGWGNDVLAHCDAFVFLTLDPGVRLRRLAEREQLRQSGQAPHSGAVEQFMLWAAGYDDPDFSGRSRAHHESWLKNEARPVLRLDSAHSTAQMCPAIMDWEPVRTP